MDSLIPFFQLREELETVISGSIPTYEEVKKLQYSLCIFKEITRLYPNPIVKETSEEVNLGPYTIPSDVCASSF